MALKVANIEDIQMKSLVEMLENSHFDLLRTQHIMLPPTAPLRMQTAALYVNHKHSIGVEIFEEECKVVVSKVQISVNGSINIQPLCMPLRLWFNRPEFLRAFLQEIIEPSKANGTIQSLPEA